MKYANLLIFMFFVGCSDVGEVQDTSSKTENISDKNITDDKKVDENEQKNNENQEDKKEPQVQQPEKPYKNPFQPSTEIDPNTPKYIEPVPEKKEYLNGKELKTLPNIVSTDIKLTKNIYWQISETVKIESGVRVSIEAGTEIFGKNSNSKIEFQQGSQLLAIGKKDSPIIFTSKNDILGKESNGGEWGGIALKNIDNSIMKYVQIRFSGYNQPSLKLENLNYSNIFEFVEIAFSNSDGVQISGGEINLRNIVILGANGDGLAVTNGWNGKVQNIYIHQFSGTFGERSSGLEIGSNTVSIITNLTINSDSEKVGAGIYIRDKADFQLSNSIISGKRAGVCVKSQELSDKHYFEFNVLNCQNGSLEKVKLDKEINILLSKNISLKNLAKKVEPKNPYLIDSWFDEYSQFYIGSFNFNYIRKWSDGWTFGMEEIFDEK